MENNSRESIKKDILLIGGGGYVGLYLTKNLVESGYSPVVLTPNPEKVSYINFMKEVKLIKGSVTDSYLVGKLVKDKKVVVNMAGFIDKEGGNPLKSLEINCGGELNVLEGLRRNNQDAHHIFLGTRAQFGKIGRNGELVGEEQKQEPISIYGIHKRICEDYLRYYQATVPLDIASLRLVGIYGPALLGEPRHFVSGLVKRCLEGKDLVLNGDGSQIQDFIYIEDLASLLQIMIEKRTTGIYNCGSGQGLAMKEIAEIIRRKCGRENKIVYKTLSQTEDYSDLDGSIMNIRQISKITGWQPKTNICDGTDKIIKWLKNRKVQTNS